MLSDKYYDEVIRRHIELEKLDREREKLKREQEIRRKIFWGWACSVFRWIFLVIALLACIALITWLLFVIGGNCQ